MAMAIIESYHNELKEWDRVIGFYVMEVRVFEKRLEEVVKLNSKKEVLAEAEHFQNQFILQKEQFDQLQHQIHQQEARIKSEVLSDKPSINMPVTDKQVSLTNKMQVAERIFEETRRSFYHFLSKAF